MSVDEADDLRTQDELKVNNDTSKQMTTSDELVFPALDSTAENLNEVDYIPTSTAPTEQKDHSTTADSSMPSTMDPSQMLIQKQAAIFEKLKAKNSRHLGSTPLGFSTAPARATTPPQSSGQLLSNTINESITEIEGDTGTDLEDDEEQGNEDDGDHGYHEENSDIDVYDEEDASDEISGILVPISSHQRKRTWREDQHANTSRKRRAKVGTAVGKSRPAQECSKPVGKARASRASGVFQKLLQNDVFVDTAATAHLSKQNVFGQHARRADAIKALTADPEGDLKQLNADTSALKSALTYLNGNENGTGRNTAKQAQDGSGGWIIRGITTPLKSYQVMGVAFMRQVENRASEPRGGLLCDDMGLGKTIQTLATIVNGQAPFASQVRATLVVAAPALLRQWRSEIELCCGSAIGEIITYDAQYRSYGDDHARIMLSKAAIVLTTYYEVSRSYPKAVYPPHIGTEQEKNAWWEQCFTENRGVLHQIKWLRVCLDEAACIKNDATHQSKACCALQYQHGWAITGTPVMNRITEFYPLFKFVRCPETTSLKNFKQNFDDEIVEDGRDKLNRFLDQYMLRRTHGDTLFNRRLLDLPKPSERLIWIQFSPVERRIYSVVLERIKKKINTIVAHEATDISRTNHHAWTLLVRLRQMCSHVLLIQDILINILERSDWEELNALSSSTASSSESDYRLLKHLRMVMQISTDRQQQRSNDTTVQDDQTAQHSAEPQKQVAHCYACKQPVVNPHLTSCNHLYCYDCLEYHQHLAASRGMSSARCLVCGIMYESARSVDEETLAKHLQINKHLASYGFQGNYEANPTEEMKIEKMITNPSFPFMSSTKLQVAKQQIKEWLDDDPSQKIIVFSQFLCTIMMLEAMCKQEKGWDTVRYIGTMSHGSRAKAVRLFEMNANKRIMLASLKCGGQGLNLTMASRVLSLDPWYNKAVESQAFGRVFRIGQTRETEMVRLVVEDSIDAAMHAMKQRKQVDIDAVMGSSRSRLSVRDMMELLGKVEKDSSGRLIILGRDQADQEA